MTFQESKTHLPQKPERPLLDLLKVTTAWKTASLPKSLEKVVAITLECIIKSDNYVWMLTVATSDFMDSNEGSAAVLDGLALIKQTNSECPRPGPGGQQMVPRTPILTLAWEWAGAVAAAFKQDFPCPHQLCLPPNQTTPLFWVSHLGNQCFIT